MALLSFAAIIPPIPLARQVDNGVPALAPPTDRQPGHLSVLLVGHRRDLGAQAVSAVPSGPV